MPVDDVVHGYAEALFSVVRAEGELDRVEDELFRFGKLLEGHHQLKQALSDQSLDRSQRVKILEELLSDKVSSHTLGLLTFIVAQGRGRQLPQILEEVSALAAEARRSVVAEVRSAVPLDEEQRLALAEALSKATDKNVEVVATRGVGGQQRPGMRRAGARPQGHGGAADLPRAPPPPAEC